MIKYLLALIMSLLVMFVETFNFKIITTVILSTIFLLVWQLYKRTDDNANKKCPPRVSGSLPFVGHLLYLANEGHLKLLEWQKLYGNVYGLNYGKCNAVILGNYNDIKETFKLEGMTNRNPKLFTFSPEFETLLEMNGKEWTDHRRFASTALRGVHRDQANEDIVQEAIDKLFENLRKKDLTTDVNIRLILCSTTNNVTFKLICGKRYDDDHPMTDFIMSYGVRFQDYLSLLPLLETIGIPKKVFSFFSSKFRAGMEAIREMDDFIREEIEAHEKNLDRESPNDFIDLSLIDILKSENSRKIHTRDQIRGDAQLLLMAGTDTVRITLEWMTLFAAKYQNYQEKVYQELTHVIGDRKPIWLDHNNTPYTDAFLMECQRMRTLIPSNISRCAPRDIVIDGYDVAKGTLVIANLLAVHKDPKLWTKPELFDPTRFLSDDGTKIIYPEFFIPFSTGNRNCLGDKIAKMEIFLIATSLIKNYKILPPTSGVSLKGTLRVTYIPIYPIVRLISRNDN